MCAVFSGVCFFLLISLWIWEGQGYCTGGGGGGGGGISYIVAGCNPRGVKISKVTHCSCSVLCVVCFQVFLLLLSPLISWFMDWEGSWSLNFKGKDGEGGGAWMLPQNNCCVVVVVFLGEGGCCGGYSCISYII